MSDTRKQVMAEIVRVMVEAKEAGQDAWRTAERIFPGTPSLVLGEAYAELMEDEADAWWRSIERTIDCEVIRNAVASAASGPAQAGSRKAEPDVAFASITVTQDAGTSAAYPRA